ncbi:site-specific integrase [Enterococcus hirae]|nr:site-specific integrase [Enterococcus hirae]EMF0192902.1 site-specific integrase [Enterococcus hirae]EMF0246099.1 site-specific integrase [Enterococcus hirae]
MASFKKLASGWQYRVSYKDKDGKYRTKSANGFDTKKEAQLAAAEIESRYSKRYSIKDGDKLFKDYFRNWFEVYRKGKLSKDNDGDIRRAVEFSERYFPDTKLKELTREEYQKALNDYGQDHATASVKKHHTYMRAAIKDAIEEGIIFRDPTYRVTAVGKKAPKHEELKYLNYADSIKLIHALLENLKPEYTSRFIILFGLATGCRFSEIIGMTWKNVDFKDKTVNIKQTWDYKYTDGFSNTKNYQSKRTITIDDDTLSLLKKLQLHQKQYYLKSGLKNENDLVFLNDSMELVTNTAVNKVLRKFCKKVGVTEITCHGLRHTHASILLYQGINIKYVSRRLGHKDIVTTLQTYQHILDEMEQKESNVVNNLMKQMYS